MGNSGSTTKLSTEINQKVYNELESVMKVAGSNSSTEQDINISGLDLVIVGNKDCNETPIVTFKNENTMTLDNTIDAASKAFADTIADLSSTISNNNKSGWSIGSTTIVDNTSNTEIKNAIKNKIQTDCGNAEVRQKISVTDSLMDLTCARLDLANENTQTVACIMDSISDVTSKLEGDITTKASTSIGNNTTIIIIAIVLVVLFIIFLIIIIYAGIGNKSNRVVYERPPSPYYY